MLKAMCILASLHLHGEVVAAIVLLRRTITPHYILILFPTRITSHLFSLVSLVYGSSIPEIFWQMTAKYMFDLSERDSNIDKKSAALLGTFVRTGDLAIISASQLTKTVTPVHRETENFKNKSTDFS